ncbi:hypothetical protein [Shewanella sp. FJAT-51649]|uniref:hypothetical protein n=1 Tax=Shewanella sp. FJAT-51649 TaxID=2864210 RepID=UPI0021ABE3F4|nr:hypothetical protein [Shewanella sp. FJAT-51649]
MRKFKLAAFLSLIMMLGGCASYTTPGGSVAIGSLAESDINALMSVQAGQHFPRILLWHVFKRRDMHPIV